MGKTNKKNTFVAEKVKSHENGCKNVSFLENKR